VTPSWHPSAPLKRLSFLFSSPPPFFLFLSPSFLPLPSSLGALRALFYNYHLCRIRAQPDSHSPKVTSLIAFNSLKRGSLKAPLLEDLALLSVHLHFSRYLQPASNVHARKERPRMPWRAQTHKTTGEEVSNIVHSIIYAALRLSALLSAKTPRSVGPSVDLRSRHVGHIVAGACPRMPIITWSCIDAGSMGRQEPL
jgi:hypothetical protein